MSDKSSDENQRDTASAAFNVRPRCPKNHRFRPISFNEKTGEAVYACKCGIKWPRKAKFMCEVKGAA